MNLLLINADQFRHDCLGFRGLREVKTPNLDKLASEGVVYTHAFTPLPVCAPARQALLCGRHPDSFGAQWNYDFIPTATVQPVWCWPLRLADKGYQTAYLGRFHVSNEHPPSAFGYGEWINWRGHHELMNEKYPDIEFEGGWLGCESPVALEDSGTHWMAERAVETIKKFSTNGKPWHIWVDYEEPHLPCRPSKPFSEMYDASRIPPWDGFGDSFEGKPYCHRQQSINWGIESFAWEDFAPMVARYFSVVSQIDDALGKILRALEECGQKDETIIVFTSDHGDMCGSHQMLDKHYVMYDDIARVPLIIRVPGIEPRTDESFVSNCLDVPAFIGEWFSLEGFEAVHGKSLPIDENAKTRGHIVSTSNGQQFGLYTTRMLRDKKFKYVWNLTDVDELYDLEFDPGEKINLIASQRHFEIIASMRKTLHGELVSHGDRFAGNEWMKRQLLEGRKHI